MWNVAQLEILPDHNCQIHGDATPVLAWRSGNRQSERTGHIVRTRRAVPGKRPGQTNQSERITYIFEFSITRLGRSSHQNLGRIVKASQHQTRNCERASRPGKELPQIGWNGTTQHWSGRESKRVSRRTWHQPPHRPDDYINPCPSSRNPRNNHGSIRRVLEILGDSADPESVHPKEIYAVLTQHDQNQLGRSSTCTQRNVQAPNAFH